jgi:hypothetical protein
MPIDFGELDRDLLHVMVAGPGFGEGVAVALPGRGWILVDGCRVDGPVGGDLPLAAIVERYRGSDDPISWMVLTHPHEDHAAGFAETLDRLQPDSVGLAGLDPPQRSLLSEAESWVEASASHEVTLRRRQVLAAFRALIARSEAGRPLAVLHAGKHLVETERVRVEVLAPLPGAMNALFTEANGNWRKIGPKVNSLSVVLLIEFGSTRVVLAADQITEPDRGTGWRAILPRSPTAAAPHGLKVPHHGSAEAHHEDLMSVGPSGSTWWVTPFSKKRMPRPNPDLGPLLSRNAPVRLTVMPTRSARERAGERTQLGLTDYAACFESNLPDWLGEVEEITPPRPLEPFDPLWAAGFDDRGAAVRHWRGSAAIELTG